MVEKIPGMGTTMANTSGRYGIIAGRMARTGSDGKEVEPLILVSFPYASPEGYTLEIDGRKRDINVKGIVNEDTGTTVNKSFLIKF